MSNSKRGAADERLSLANAAEMRFMLSEELAGKRLLMLSKGYVPLPSTGKKVPLLGWSNLDADGTQCGIQPTIEDIDSWSARAPGVEQHVRTLRRRRRYRLRCR